MENQAPDETVKQRSIVSLLDTSLFAVLFFGVVLFTSWLLSFHDGWPWGIARSLIFILLFAAASVGATLLARHLRRGNPITRTFLLLLAAFIFLAFLGGISFSKSSWGYWMNAPKIDPRVTSAKRVIALGSFGYDPDGVRFHLKPEKGDMTGKPMNDATWQLKAAGLSIERQGKPNFDLRKLPEMLTDRRIKVRNDSGYDWRTSTDGIWAELEGRDGQKYLFIAANGCQVANDNYPHFRLLYRHDPKGDLKLVSHQVMYYDIAGMEGATWDRMFLVLSLPAIWLAVAVTFVRFTWLSHKWI